MCLPLTGMSLTGVPSGNSSGSRYMSTLTSRYLQHSLKNSSVRNTIEGLYHSGDNCAKAMGCLWVCYVHPWINISSAKTIFWKPFATSSTCRYCCSHSNHLLLSVSLIFGSRRCHEIFNPGSTCYAVRSTERLSSPFYSGGGAVGRLSFHICVYLCLQDCFTCWHQFQWLAAS